VTKQWKKSKTYKEAIHHALSGLGYSFRSERNIRIQVVLFIVVLLAGWYLGLSTTGLVILILTSTIVLTLELINTSMEDWSNAVSREYREELRRVKDVAAGAVLIASIAAVAIGLLLFIPALL
jgi:diacylglycerol kinase